MKRFLFALILLFPMSLAFGQAVETSELPEAPRHSFGVRFGYSLQLPSENTYNGQDFLLTEAGHEINYGAYLIGRLDRNVQFQGYFGLQHVFWPKSLGYSNDCEQDSFPTFLSTDDSIPGRDIRLFNLVFEPALRIYIPKLTIFLKFQPQFALNLRNQIENYAYGCNGQLDQGPVEFTETENRAMSRVNVALGLGIVKEVTFGGETGISLEPGFKFNLSSVFTVRDETPMGPSFTLYPWGFYLNVSVFR